MYRFAAFVALCLAGPAFAQSLVADSNGTVTGSFLGKDIALDVLCERSPVFKDSAFITTHTPLSQSLIDVVTEDAVSINMFNNGASFLANINGETFMAADTDFGAPEFPVSAKGDNFDILISCPVDF